MSDTSVGEDLPNQIERVRKLAELYREPLMCGAGEPAARLMDAAIKEGKSSMASGDVIRIVKAYATLKDFGDG